MVTGFKHARKTKKPAFIRRDWNKYVRLGKSVKKKRVWRRAFGGDSPVRMKQKGYTQKPEVGFMNTKTERGKVNGFVPVRIETLSGLNGLNNKEHGIIIANLGKRKRNQIIAKANEMKITILNRYLKNVNEQKLAKANSTAEVKR